ncbi:MAG: NAD+ synthase [Methanosarcinales archaeon]|nr:NAD+ synthase [Methanosarcinales archaeon]
MDIDEAQKNIVDFIRNYVGEAGTDGVVIGLSGGLDSAVTAYLAVEALGMDNVLGVMMPELSTTCPDSLLDASKVADTLGIELKTVEISKVVDSYALEMGDEYKATNIEANGNLKSRIRMGALYYHANSLNRLVIGTGNKSEIVLGYFTKYGDGGVDLEPIGGLYKTEVRILARSIGVAEDIIRKPPSAELCVDQYDETDLGNPYEVIDEILVELIDNRKSVEDVKEQFNMDKDIDELVERIQRNAHKSSMPPIAHID